MGKTALALVAALSIGAGAGFVTHTKTAEVEGTRPSRALVMPAAVTQTQAQRPPRGVPRDQLAVPAARTSAATLRIPRLHFNTPIFAARKLDRGPAWWPITGRPGGGDTVAVAGHRTTHTKPFYFLERLRRGDRIDVIYLGRRHLYRVSDTRVVSANNLHIADAVGHERLLLTACTPRGSAAFRLIVEAIPAVGARR
jgi:LPXTG-site transpeptidase (sortase) family protein